MARAAGSLASQLTEQLTRGGSALSQMSTEAFGQGTRDVPHRVDRRRMIRNRLWLWLVLSRTPALCQFRRHQASTLALLQLVLEASAELRGGAPPARRPTLCFVVRDHVGCGLGGGGTPLATLAAQLKEQLREMKTKTVVKMEYARAEAMAKIASKSRSYSQVGAACRRPGTAWPGRCCIHRCGAARVRPPRA